MEAYKYEEPPPHVQSYGGGARDFKKLGTEEGLA
jgi:hypothetical protein